MMKFFRDLTKRWGEEAKLHYEQIYKTGPLKQTADDELDAFRHVYTAGKMSQLFSGSDYVDLLNNPRSNIANSIVIANLLGGFWELVNIHDNYKKSGTLHISPATIR